MFHIVFESKGYSTYSSGSSMTPKLKPISGKKFSPSQKTASLRMNGKLWFWKVPLSSSGMFLQNVARKNTKWKNSMRPGSLTTSWMKSKLSKKSSDAPRKRWPRQHMLRSWNLPTEILFLLCSRFSSYQFTFPSTWNATNATTNTESNKIPNQRQ